MHIGFHKDNEKILVKKTVTFCLKAVIEFLCIAMRSLMSVPMIAVSISKELPPCYKLLILALIFFPYLSVSNTF